MTTGTKLFICIVLFMGVIIAAVAFGNMAKKNDAKVTTDAYSTETQTTETPTDLSDNPASTEAQDPMNATTAIFHTTMGDVTLTLDTANTPNTVANFTKLAASGFYNGTKFHRVIAGFMVQGGDPLSKEESMKDRWGTGGPGYKFADEIKTTNSNAKGTIAMANSGPNTNGSQFFINVADNSFLNPKHTVFGKVTAGYDVIQKISETGTDDSDRPLADVVITSIELK